MTKGSANNKEKGKEALEQTTSLPWDVAFSLSTTKDTLQTTRSLAGLFLAGITEREKERLITTLLYCMP